METMTYSLAAGILALLFAAYLVYKIRKNDKGTPKMMKISQLIHDGAKSYLNAQYKILAVFVIVVAAVLSLLININTALAFMLGAFLSALTGTIGMRVATDSNARAASGCSKGLGRGFQIAFSSGAVTGMSVVGLGLIGIIISYQFLGDVSVLFGFGFGASSIALFARVGGGIYTKAADVGADLAGKVEAGIPEDDPRNPAVIADNVGDNVGDVAGMGSDLFESYVDSIIAAMAIGVIALGAAGLQLPITLAAVGILSSILASFLVRVRKENLYAALNRGIFASAIIMAIASYFVIQSAGLPFGIFYALLSGLAAGIIVGLVTEFYISPKNRPTQSIAEASQTGPATNIITGISTGMESTVIPIITICAAILLSYHFSGLYGIAIAAVGMLSTLGLTLAMETYGSVVDNAAGIAEMSGMKGEVRSRAEKLDSVGNTTAAIGKGFAIGSAALTGLVLFSVYSSAVNLSAISITDPYVVVGLFIGGLLPFLFSSFTMRAVGTTAMKMVNEVRRQFKHIKAMKGRAEPDYDRCIIISTNAALRHMIAPGLLAVLTPIAVGLLLGAQALGGLLAGSLITSFALALMMANAGGAWDNAKKYIESGKLGGKGSDAHKAAVIGDTVGDPMKDTSGPSLNILIKLISIIALVFASLFM